MRKGGLGPRRGTRPRPTSSPFRCERLPAPKSRALGHCLTEGEMRSKAPSVCARTPSEAGHGGFCGLGHHHWVKGEDEVVAGDRYAAGR